MSKARATLGSTGVFASTSPADKNAPETKPASSAKRPDREGRVPLPFWTTAPAKKQLRLMAAEGDTTQQDLMSEALNLLFKSRGKPPIA
jgi:Antitoxin-like ribbon-helix-helix